MRFLFYWLSIHKEASFFGNGYAFQFERFGEHDIVFDFQRGLGLGNDTPRRRLGQLVLVL